MFFGGRHGNRMQTKQPGSEVGRGLASFCSSAYSSLFEEDHLKGLCWKLIVLFFFLTVGIPLLWTSGVQLSYQFSGLCLFVLFF